MSFLRRDFLEVHIICSGSLAIDIERLGPDSAVILINHDITMFKKIHGTKNLFGLMGFTMYSFLLFAYFIKE